jgi:DNA/RNA endonuclease YhcR with UshA esterase domain
MKLTALVIGLTTLVLVGAAGASVQTQPGQMTGPGMMGPMMMGNYDLKAETTIKGIVEKLEQPGFGHMYGMGVRLFVKSGNETFWVHLGPAAFVERTMTFKEGDKVEVTGSRMIMMGQTSIVAREVKKGDTILKLRNENGMPLWPGMNMRGWHS